jgi:hypothetical protein
MAEQTRGDGSRAAVMASGPRQPAAEQGDRSSPSGGGRDQAAITRASFCGRLLLEAVVILGLTEAAYRVWNHVPLLQLPNFSGMRMDAALAGKGAQFDAVLGWVPIPNHSGRAGLTADYHTLDHGIRRNRSDQTTLATGGWSSDHPMQPAPRSTTTSCGPRSRNAWIGMPVTNGAVSGYGIDQVVMGAEAPPPIIKPDILVVEIIRTTIQWDVYSVRGKPKPNFVLEDGELRLLNSPVSYAPSIPRFTRVKNALGCSLAIERLMETNDPFGWLGLGEIRSAERGDETLIACRLLDRLRQVTDRSNVRLVVVTQMTGPDLVRRTQAPANLQFVETCAHAMGLQVIDTFPRLAALASQAPHAVDDYYVMHANAASHMNARGNAALAAACRRRPFASADARAVRSRGFRPGDRVNLLPDTEALDRPLSSTPHAILRANREGGSPREFRLTAISGPGEHYVASDPLNLGAGPFRLSFVVHPEAGTGIRAQLIGSQGEGILCDLDFDRLSATATGSALLRRFSPRW